MTRPRFSPAQIKQFAANRRENLSRIRRGLGCLLCGSDTDKKGPNKLHFHHLEPGLKEFAISGGTRPWNKITKELEKCIVLCARCHQNVHFAGKSIPAGTPGICVQDAFTKAAEKDSLKYGPSGAHTTSPGSKALACGPPFNHPAG